MRQTVGKKALLKHLIQVFTHIFLLFIVISSFQVQEERLNSKVKSVRHFRDILSVLSCTCGYVRKHFYARVKYVHAQYRHMHRLYMPVCNFTLWVQVCACTGCICVRSHPRGLDFVPRGAHPSGVVRQSLTLFSLQTRLHLTPPFSNYNGRWGRGTEIHNKAG